MKEKWNKLRQRLEDMERHRKMLKNGMYHNYKKASKGKNIWIQF